jgi:hypothetical protein
MCPTYQRLPPSLSQGGGGVCCGQCCVCELQNAKKKKKLHGSANRPAAYSALCITPTLARSQSVQEEAYTKQCSEPLLYYPLPFFGLKPSVQVAQETKGKNEKKTRQMSQIMQSGWAVQVMFQTTFPSRFPHKQKSQTLVSGDLGGHNLVLMILSLNTSCNTLIILCSMCSSTVLLKIAILSPSVSCSKNSF